jgi:RecA/RadA recombinase
MNKLKEKILKNTTIEFTSTLLESKIYTHKDMIPTTVPMINVALSGTLYGGLTPGFTMIAGQSRNFKTGFSLLLAASFLAKYPDGIVLFYDSEFGTTPAYFKIFEIDMNYIVHTPITNIEMLKIDLLKQLDELSRDDHVMIIIDSIGNLASRKEVEDTLNQKTVADMTRAKQLKSLFRMVTPYLTIKDIPMIAVNHTYKEIGLYPKDIVGGGTGGFYSADNVWIVGRQQEKEKDTLAGYNFIINVEKSRFVKEKSKIPVTVTHEKGVHKWSGLFDVALETGHIVKAKQGWYKLASSEGNFQRADVVNNSAFWEKLINDTDFPLQIEERYKLG